MFKDLFIVKLFTCLFSYNKFQNVFSKRHLRKDASKPQTDNSHHILSSRKTRKKKKIRKSVQNKKYLSKALT